MAWRSTVAVGLPRGVERPASELANRLEQAEARVSAEVVHLHERLVDEVLELADHLVRLDPVARHHRLGGLEGER